MATLFMMGVLLPMAVAVVGVLLHGRDVNRLRRFVPGSFDSGVTILAEPVTVTQAVADPNVNARLHQGEIFFLRRSLSAGFSEFPAGRIVEKHGAPNVQIRISRGSALFYAGAFTFLTFVAVWSRSWIPALLSTAMACSVVAMVRRERRWGRTAAAACVAYFGLAENQTSPGWHTIGRW